jgi:glycosyltransferase involved in cell wall biosynthesis
MIDDEAAPGEPAARDRPAGRAEATSARVLAVIPAHDEAPRIGAVVAAAIGHVPVLVVDDGSSDDTAAVAEAAGATVIRQVPNQGKGAALRAGFRRAMDEGYDAVITLDGDGQHDPGEIPAFLAAFPPVPPPGPTVGPAAAQPALVVGRRDFRQMPPIRRLANTLGTVAFSWAVGRHIPDNQSGYWLISRPVMEAALASDESGFEFEVEMLTTTIRLGLPIAWVPIRTIYGDERSHIRPLDHLRHFLRIVRQARKDVRSG